MTKAAHPSGNPLIADFNDFIADPQFPCVGAKSALAKGQLRVVIAKDIRSAWDDLDIMKQLLELAFDYRRDPVLFQSLAVIFETDAGLDEERFEHHLWARLQSLSDKDEWLGQRPDPRVSTDPQNPHFSLSFGGEAFFVVGLHPGASRPARRFRTPVLIFNLHDQFEQLREAGRYEKMRSIIIERDVELAGDPNPMLSRHGDTSEARQYSGRAVPADWLCPLEKRHAHVE